MATINLEAPALELPIIPRQRDDFLSTLRQTACGEWEDIFDDIDPSGSMGNVQFLDEVWEYFIKEYDDFTILPEVLYQTPFGYQWRLWQLMVWQDYKGLSEYANYFAALEGMVQAPKFGVRFLALEKIQTHRILSAIFKEETPEQIEAAWLDRKAFFLPIYYPNGESSWPLFNWNAAPVVDWLRDNLSNFEGCPFYFEDDPISLQTRYLRD